MFATISFTQSLQHSFSYWVKSMYVPPHYMNSIFNVYDPH